MKPSLTVPLLAIMFAPVVAHAKPTVAQPEVSFELDTSALPEDWSTDYINVHLVEHQIRILQGGGFEVVDSGAATIRVTLSRYGNNDIHYRFTVASFDEGIETAVVERTLTCEKCTDTALFISIGQEVARQSGRLLYAVEDGHEGEPQGEQMPSTNPPWSEETEPAAVARRVGGWGYAGVGLAIAGVGAGIWGVAVLAKEPTRGFVQGTALAEKFSKPRRRGRQLVYVSAGLLLAGTALVALDQTFLLERRKHRALSISVIPSFSPTEARLSFVRRF